MKKNWTIRFSVRQIFEDHWPDYEKTHNVRQVEKEEVEKMLSCKKKGCFVCHCLNCGKYVTVPFGCNSRLCSRCGKRYTDRWAKKLAKKLPKVIHRHLTFSMPDLLWGFVKVDRYLQKVISDAANETIQEMFNEIVKTNQEITVGVTTVIHPFKKDIEFDPHVHSIVTEGGFTKDKKFVQVGPYIDYNTFHRKWQKILLKNLEGHIPQGILNFLKDKYPKGFCVYVKPKRIKWGKKLIEYIGRYLRHPAIADSRIEAYNDEAVRFYWEDADKNVHKRVMLVYDFISAIIQHIPERNEKMVRHYGAYSRRMIKVSRGAGKQLTIEQGILYSENKGRVYLCPYCDVMMEIVGYLPEQPPPDMTKITNWID